MKQASHMLRGIKRVLLTCVAMLILSGHAMNAIYVDELKEVYKSLFDFMRVLSKNIGPLRKECYQKYASTALIPLKFNNERKIYALEKSYASKTLDDIQKMLPTYIALLIKNDLYAIVYDMCLMEPIVSKKSRLCAWASGMKEREFQSHWYSSPVVQGIVKFYGNKNDLIVDKSEVQSLYISLMSLIQASIGPSFKQCSRKKYRKIIFVISKS